MTITSTLLYIDKNRRSSSKDSKLEDSTGKYEIKSKNSHTLQSSQVKNEEAKPVSTHAHDSIK